MGSVKRECRFVRDCFWDARAELRAQGGRSLLAVLGLSIGVGFTATVIDFAHAVNSYLTNDVIARIYTPNSFEVERVASVPSRLDSRDAEEAARREQRRQPLQLADADAVGTRIRDGGDWTSEDLGQAVAMAPGSRKLAVTTILYEGNYKNAKDLRLEAGRMPTSDEITGGAAIAVVGHDVATHFFGNQSPVGKRLRVAGVSHLIVGVAARRGTLLGISLDRFVVASTKGQLRRTFRLGDRTQRIFVRADGPEDFATIREAARRALRNRHHLPTESDDDFAIESADDVTGIWYSVEKKIAVFAAAFPVAALLTSILVIANVMLARVSLRTVEIGLRRALGATRSHIAKQFLIESLVLSFGGAGIGLVISWATSALISVASPIFVHPTIASGLVAVVAAASVGALAGLGPAITAARLDPIVALGRG